MGNMRFKAGDRVRIKSLDWYNENKDEYGAITFSTDSGEYMFTKEDVHFCNRVVTISEKEEGHYLIAEDARGYLWIDEMIECKVEEETKPEPKFKVGDKIKLKSKLLNDIFGVIGYESEGYRITNISNGLTYFMSYSIEHDYELVEEEALKQYEVPTGSIKIWDLPSGYIFKDERGNEIHATKIVLEKKKKEYPKTYKECMRILGFTTVYTPKVEPMFDYDDDIIALQKLKNCRDAYWKLYGEEMGLGKPWKPDWNDGEWKWCISYSCNCVEFDQYKSKHHTLAFPTPEMRDAFKENFDPDLEICKELL